MNRNTKEIRRLCLDVILLDGEQDAAPSLADMARRAKALLDGPLAVTRRPARPSVKAKKAAKAEKKAARVEIRGSVFLRAQHACELCQVRRAEELHHLLAGVGNRTPEETVETCVAACRPCHKAWHAGDLEVLEASRLAAVTNGSAEAAAAVQRRIDKVRAVRAERLAS